jgi:hypothetical protein
MMRKRIVLPALLVCYIAIVVLLSKWGNVSFEGAVVTVTGFILIWYAWETFRLRVEAQKQTELSLRPCVIAIPRRADSHWELKNIGNGTALDISIEDVHISKHEIPGNPAWRPVLSFPSKIPFLQKDKSVYIIPKVLINGSEMDTVWSAHFKPESAVYESKIRIIFHNIYMNKYTLTETIAPGELSIADIVVQKSI